MRSATTVHTAAKRMSIATVYAAKESSEKPRSSRACRPEVESCPVGHVTVGHGTCNKVNSAGMPRVKRPRANAATAIHATRASRSQRPRYRTGCAATPRVGGADIIFFLSGGHLPRLTLINTCVSYSSQVRTTVPLQDNGRFLALLDEFSWQPSLQRIHALLRASVNNASSGVLGFARWHHA